MEANTSHNAGINEICNWLSSEKLNHELDSIHEDDPEIHSKIDKLAEHIMTQMNSIKDQSGGLDHVSSLIREGLRKANESGDKAKYDAIHSAANKTLTFMSISNTKEAKQCYQLISQALAEDKNYLGETLDDLKSKILNDLNLPMLRQMGMTSPQFNIFVTRLLIDRINNSPPTMTFAQARDFLTKVNALKEAGVEGINPITALKLKKITNEELKQLIILCPDLKYLDLTDNTKLKGLGLAPLSGLINLRSLNLQGCYNISGEGLACLSSLTNLQNLNLLGMVTDKELAYLSGLKNLQNLSLNSCSALTDKGLVQLSGLTNLQNLNLSGCFKLTDEGLTCLNGMINLLKLDLTYCEKLTDDGLAILSGLTTLQSLDLSRCSKLTDKGLERLSKLINLISLDLVNCYKMTDNGLAHLSRLTNLVSLDLNNCDNLTDAGLAHLAGLTQLQTLKLYNCDVTEEGVKTFVDRGVNVNFGRLF
jgi:hypothetical protein